MSAKQRNSGGKASAPNAVQKLLEQIQALGPDEREQLILQQIKLLGPRAAEVLVGGVFWWFPREIWHWSVQFAGLENHHLRWKTIPVPDGFGEAQMMFELAPIDDASAKPIRLGPVAIEHAAFAPLVAFIFGALLKATAWQKQTRERGRTKEDRDNLILRLKGQGKTTAQIRSCLLRDHRISASDSAIRKVVQRYGPPRAVKSF